MPARRSPPRADKGGGDEFHGKQCIGEKEIKEIRELKEFNEKFSLISLSSLNSLISCLYPYGFQQIPTLLLRQLPHLADFQRGILEGHNSGATQNFDL